MRLVRIQGNDRQPGKSLLSLTPGGTMGMNIQRRRFLSLFAGLMASPFVGFDIDSESWVSPFLGCVVHGTRVPDMAHCVLLLEPSVYPLHQLMKSLKKVEEV